MKLLLAPQGQPPETVRSDWRPNQQIAVSHFDDHAEGNGWHERRFDDERYLPFEGKRLSRHGGCAQLNELGLR